MHIISVHHGSGAAVSNGCFSLHGIKCIMIADGRILMVETASTCLSLLEPLMLFLNQYSAK